MNRAHAGKAYRIRRYDELGEPEEIHLDKRWAGRLVWMREQLCDDRYGDAYHDPTNGEVIVQSREGAEPIEYRPPEPRRKRASKAPALALDGPEPGPQGEDTPPPETGPRKTKRKLNFDLF